MKGKLKKLFVLATLVIVAIALVYRSMPHRPPLHTLVPLSVCPAAEVPERWPSGGLAWSKENYPEQYGEENLTTVAFEGLDDRINERYFDAGSRSYSRSFISSFSYTEPSRAPHVQFEYLKRAEAFAGKLTARGLKPNFAYQMKLRGIFAHRQAFENIGHVGRWRMPGYATNYRDQDYEAYPDKSEVESYLLFDFFVTDAEGNADKEFYLDSTLHVLFNGTWQRKPAFEDMRPVKKELRVADSDIYANPMADTVVQAFYAQSEQHALDTDNRPAIGKAFLAPGHYVAEVVLTEESFHTFGDGGWWATVLRAPVKFDVINIPRPPVGWQEGEELLSLSLTDAALENIEVATISSTQLRGTATTQKPYVDFAEELNLPVGDRYFLRAEIACDRKHNWEAWVDTGIGFDDGERYGGRATGCLGWRRFDVEITSSVAGRTSRLRIRPATAAVGIGVRNVGIWKVTKEADPQPALGTTQ